MAAGTCADTRGAAAFRAPAQRGRINGVSGPGPNIALRREPGLWHAWGCALVTLMSDRVNV